MKRHVEGSERRELREVIRTVRRRWRLRNLLRGALFTALSAVAAIVVVTVAVDRWTGSPLGAAVFTGVLYLGVAWVAIQTLLRPMFRRVTDLRVAHYLEEHESELRAEILTAIDAMEGNATEDNALLNGLVRSAVLRARAVEGGLRVDRQPLQRLSWSGAGVAVALGFLLLADPFGLREAMPDLIRPWTAVEAAPPLAIQLSPGDTVLARGAELRVSARLLGFESERVEVAFRSEEATQWERWPMVEDLETREHDFLLFRVDEPLEYFVEAAGIRSGTHRVELTDFPYVSRLQLQIHPPAYTGRSPELIEYGGDLVVLPGTRVEVQAHTTIPVPAGRIVVEGVGEMELVPGEGDVLSGAFVVEADGYYHVELDDESGRTHRGSPDHRIDLVEDLPPSVSLVRPGRDVRATSIEELYVEARATDDHGVANLELVYSVNAGESQSVALLDGAGRNLREVSAGHTFFLEEYDLVPGDLVAYYARALDSGPGAAEREARTDLFFIQVRPFEQEFSQADAAGGGDGQGGGGDPMAGQFSQRQREIVTATFNVDRDWRRIDPNRVDEDVATIALAQERLLGEVEGFLAELTPRLSRAGEEMQQVAELLPFATEAMEEALEELEEARLAEALPPEQRALQFLLRAEAVFREFQLAQSDSQGGGDGQPELRDDLADYFDLDTDRMRNQYEELQRGEREELARQMDETLERLRELARRQEQERERLRRAQEQLPQGAAAGGESQRRLAEETEEMARQLERLAREQSAPELEETARRLREAAEAMRRSAAARDESGVAQAEEARERLEEARRLLDRSRTERLESEVEQAANRARQALDRQRQIEDAVQRLPQDAASRRDAVAPIQEEKEELVGELERLEEDLRRLSSEAAGADADAERSFREAAAAIRDGQLTDRVEFSRSLITSGTPERAQDFEAEVTELLEGVVDRVERAAEGLTGREADQAARIQEQTRDLVRAAESMEERARRAEERAREAGGGQEAPADAETARQLQREAGERLQQAEQLRGQLQEMGGPAAGAGLDALNEIMGQFRDLQARAPYDSPRELSQLQQRLVESLRELDFVLRRQFAADDQRGPTISGSGDVPDAYRDQVEEYFRSLTRP